MGLFVQVSECRYHLCVQQQYVLLKCNCKQPVNNGQLENRAAQFAIPFFVLSFSPHYLLVLFPITLRATSAKPGEQSLNEAPVHACVR